MSQPATTVVPASAPPASPSEDRFPPQVRYIVGTEAAERFSFYGMRNILTVFLIDYLLVNIAPGAAREAEAKSFFHVFVAGVYLFPLLGGYFADRLFGKYRTVFWLSLLYCVGHALLAIFDDNPRGFYAGLFLIALGSGGIKPCISAMVGDQFTDRNKHLVKKVFALFYWSINFGSFFASLLIPKTLKLYGPAVAFGIPGILMFVATVIFWAGRKHYIHVPPTGANPHSFLHVVSSALKNRKPGQPLLEGARQGHPPEAVEGTRAVFKILAVFAPLPFFWMLFDQKASTWVVQGRSMDPQIGSWTFEPSQMQLVNPALVMLLIPFSTYIVYPFFERLGMPLTPLRRMTLGMVLAGLSFVVAGSFQVQLDAGTTMSILWQAIPYLLLTMGEVLVATTSLEFAYSQAPRSMKGTIMALWNLAIATANLVVAGIASVVNLTGPNQFFFYAAAVTVAAIAMGLIARWYKPVDWFQREDPVKPAGEHSLPQPAKA